MTVVIVGVLAVTLLATIYGLLARHAGGVPSGTCGDCALASVCRDLQSGKGEETVTAFGDRDACYTSHAKPHPST